MIGRIWHGWTTAANADAYESVLRGEVLPGIAAMGVEGYRGSEVFRRKLDSGEVEFVTILRFDSIDAVRRFVGEDYEVAHIPPRAREVLARWDERAQHYELREHTAFDGGAAIRSARPDYSVGSSGNGGKLPEKIMPSTVIAPESGTT